MGAGRSSRFLGSTDDMGMTLGSGRALKRGLSNCRSSRRSNTSRVNAGFWMALWRCLRLPRMTLPTQMPSVVLREKSVHEWPANQPGATSHKSLLSRHPSLL